MAGFIDSTAYLFGRRCVGNASFVTISRNIGRFSRHFARFRRLSHPPWRRQSRVVPTGFRDAAQEQDFGVSWR
ncbi:MAG: hypothetical protein ABI056_05210 [Caulobacteraceae bacterium]